MYYSTEEEVSLPYIPPPNKAMSVPSETNPLHYKITCNFEDCLCFFSSKCSLLPVLWICKYELTVSVSTHLCFVVFLPPLFCYADHVCLSKQTRTVEASMLPSMRIHAFYPAFEEICLMGPIYNQSKTAGREKNVKPLNQKPFHKDENTSPLYPEAKCKEKSVKKVSNRAKRSDK